MMQKLIEKQVMNRLVAKVTEKLEQRLEKKYEELKCRFECPDEDNVKICGTDGKTYHSQCAFECARNRDTELMPDRSKKCK